MANRFTLVELVVAVAIMSVLAAIAIPAFAAAQLRARQAEGPLVTDGIVLAWTAQATEGPVDPNPVSALVPDDRPGRGTRPWVASGWARSLAFAPDGEVRAAYMLAMTTSTCAVAAWDVVCDDQNPCASAVFDLDLDGVRSCYSTRPPTSGGVAAAALWKSPAGAY